MTGYRTWAALLATACQWRSGLPSRSYAAPLELHVGLQVPEDDVVRELVRKETSSPPPATAPPVAPLGRSRAGNPAEPVTPVAQRAAPQPAPAATLATGRGAAAMSARYRGRRR